MLSVEGYEFTILMDALEDARKRWASVRRDIQDGTNPNASLQGCELIQEDVENLIRKLKAIE